MQQLIEIPQPLHQCILTLYDLFGDPRGRALAERIVLMIVIDLQRAWSTVFAYDRRN
jgi:hypothetical protein